jgi:hypothetical protein
MLTVSATLSQEDLNAIWGLMFWLFPISYPEAPPKPLNEKGTRSELTIKMHPTQRHRVVGLQDHL